MNIFNIGPTELLMILVIAIIVFGPNKIPEIGASIGKSLRQFRDASRELTNGINLEDLNPSEDPETGEAAAQATSESPAVGTPATEAAVAETPAADSPVAEVSPEPSPAPAVEPSSTPPAPPPYLATETPPPLVEPASATEPPRLPPAPQQRRFVVSREAWAKPPEEEPAHVEPA